MDGWRNGKQATSVMWLDYCKLSAIWPISVVPRSGTPFPELDPTASVGVVMLSCFSQCIRAKTAITTFPYRPSDKLFVLSQITSHLFQYGLSGKGSATSKSCAFSPLWRTHNNYVQFMSFHYWPRGKVSSKINWPTPHHSSLQLARAYVFHRQHVNLHARNYLLECVSDEAQTFFFLRVPIELFQPFFFSMFWIHF